MALQTLDTYTSQSQVMRLFSAMGAKLRLDDQAEQVDVAITGTPTSGTYTLTYGGNATPAITYNGDREDVQDALRHIDALANVEVHTFGTSPNYTHRITLVDIVGDATAITAAESLAGGTPVITIGVVQTGSDDAFDDAIIMACEEINKWCWKYYTGENLGTSNLVNQWATFLSCYYLSQRRGNPALFSDMRKEILEELKQVNFGNLQLPNIPMRRSLAPVISNQRADPRYVWKVLRLEKQGSTRTPATTQPQTIDFGESYSVEW